MLIKVLEHKWVIRIFGILLILAPFLNILITVTQFKTMPSQWDMVAIKKVAMGASTPFLMLQVCSLIIGIVMLRGATTAWKYVLVLVGGHIILQLTQFHQFRGDRTPWVFLITDFAVFLFIADQLVWKVKMPELKRAPKVPKPAVATIASSELPAPPAALIAEAESETRIPASLPGAPAVSVPRSISLTSKERILIHLQGFGAWGQLLDVSSWGICVRAIVPNVPNVVSKPLEIGISKDVFLKLKFVKQNGSDYYFNYTNLTEAEVTLLNDWLIELAA
ncbi:MAG: hypothetical protein V4736_15850 [Bdellovibrionota bacterium]